MILITCALKYEAKPLIAKFGLSHVIEITEYKLYRNEEIFLLITGVGKVKSATALGFFFGKVGKPNFAINIGICGSTTETIPLKSAILAHKIYDESSNRDFFSKINFSHPFKEATLHTYDKPVTFKLMESVVVDMEGSGFFQSANKFLDNSQIFCVKIVSDYLTSDKISPDFIETIIDEKCEVISEFLQIFKNKQEEKPLSTLDRLNLSKAVK